MKLIAFRDSEYYNKRKELVANDMLPIFRKISNAAVTVLQNMKFEVVSPCDGKDDLSYYFCLKDFDKINPNVQMYAVGEIGAFLKSEQAKPNLSEIDQMMIEKLRKCFYYATITAKANIQRSAYTLLTNEENKVEVLRRMSGEEIYSFMHSKDADEGCNRIVFSDQEDSKIKI